MLAHGTTHIGHVRERNEDAYFVGNHVLVVADGMGGHQGGNVASHTAIDIISGASHEAGKDPEKFLRSCLGQANRAIFEVGTSQYPLLGMGTTATVAVISEAEDHSVIGHVGDSRAYLLRDGELRQITVDHSLVEEMVRAGEITEEEALHHPQRSIITRALGVEPAVEIDIVREALVPGDVMLLCSDGLTAVVRDEAISEVIGASATPEEICDRLVAAALAAGGPDNITVVAAIFPRTSGGDGGNGSSSPAPGH